MNEPVYFCEPDYYPLSNFSAFAIEWKGRVWPTSEHAYQAEKYSNEEIIEKLFRSRSVDEVYRIAQDHKSERRADWDEVKIDLMKDILKEKMKQHPIIETMLIESGDRPLIKDTWKDNFWGWGPNKDGKNMLGVLWMEVRNEVRKSQAA